MSGFDILCRLMDSRHVRALFPMLPPFLSTFLFSFLKFNTGVGGGRVATVLIGSFLEPIMFGSGSPIKT
jgi:hypothetical protein